MDQSGAYLLVVWNWCGGNVDHSVLTEVYCNDDDPGVRAGGGVGGVGGVSSVGAVGVGGAAGGGTSEYVRNELRAVVGARSARPELHTLHAPDLDPLLNFDMPAPG